MVFFSASLFAEKVTLEVANVWQEGVEYSATPSPLAHVAVYVGDKKRNAFFIANRKANKSLEQLSEDGSAKGFVKSLRGTIDVNPDAPILPGKSVSVELDVKKGDRVSVAVMLVQSNDKFYAPTLSIPLYDKKGNLIKGDITRYFHLWDAGTEVDEEPGVGKNQPLRQGKPNTGKAERGTVKIITSGVPVAEDGFAYPAVEEQIRVTIN